MARRRRKGAERRIAVERIEILFRLAEKQALGGNLPRANRYAALAAKIGMRYNVRVPAAFKRRYCRTCHAYLLPPRSARVRVARGRVVVTCLACGAVQRVPYRREQKAARARRTTATSP
jgi:ribonuclease P protein subunit RPR2